MRRILRVVGVLVLGAILWRGMWWEPSHITVRREVVRDSALSLPFAGKTVALISDLHLTPDSPLVTPLNEILKELSPDYLFLLGDYIAWGGPVEPALSFLESLSATCGVYGVLGDYDGAQSRQSCLFCHEKGSSLPTTRHPVQFLKNRHVTIKGEGQPFNLLGLDNPTASRLRTLKENGLPTLVLAHDPLTFDALSGDEGILMLSGDTHGGQIPLPSWLWSLLGYEKNARYNKGWYVKGRNRLFVTSGVGTSHIRLRLFCLPEVVVLTFNPDGGDQ